MVTVDIQLKNSVVTHDRRLDRIPRYDEASRRYQFRTLIELHQAGFPPAKGYENMGRKSAWHRPNVTLDQDPWGGCEGFSLAQGLNASPIRLRPPIRDDLALQMYFEMQKIDPWAGGEYPGASPVFGGTDHISAMKVARDYGYIDSFWWCGAGSGTPEDDMVEALRLVGWVHFGIPWYFSMFYPDPDGVLPVEPDSGLAGYHAILGHTFRNKPLRKGERKKTEHVLVQNSWGPRWGFEYFGIGGHAKVRVEDLSAHLLPMRVWGEAAVPIQNPNRKAA